MSGLLKKIRSYFVTGLITFLPFVVTAYLVLWLIGLVDDLTDELLPLGSFPGAGFLLMFVLTIIIGFFASNIFGRFMIRRWELLIDRLPIVRVVYNSVKQLLDAVLSGEENHLGTPILIKFPNPEIYSVGFITKREAVFALGEKKGAQYITAYIPTAPNPTTGFVIMVKRSEIKELDMDSNEAMKGIISMGFSFQDAKKLVKMAKLGQRKQAGTKTKKKESSKNKSGG